MNDDFFTRVYNTTDPAEVRDVYDDWAAEYDATLKANAYATPGRVAEAAGRHLDPGAAILDFACGTGLSGAALTAHGFTAIDGYDVSPGMLDLARSSGHYRALILGDPDTPLSFAPDQYAAVTACGAISPGAAPAACLDALIACLAPGGLFIVSLNDHALKDPDYPGRIAAAEADGRVECLEAAHGAHLPHLNLGAIVYVLQRL